MDNGLDAGYESNGSVESETASLNSQNYVYRFQHGRRYHAYEYNNYFLPNDGIEMQRLNTMHWAMRELWQSSVRIPINNPGHVLDVGCGSGIWIKEVAQVLPRTQFIGVDLSPVMLADQPENLSFQVDDVNFGLQYPEASFDIVNARFLAAGIQDWWALVREMKRIITSSGNGWVQLTEIRPALLSDDNSVPANALSASWPNISFSSGEIGNTLGISRFDEVATMMKARVEAAGFTDVQLFIDKAPVGPWHPDPRLNRIGVSMAQGWLGFLEALKPALTTVYGSSAAVDNVIRQVRADYTNLNYHGYNLIYCVVGRKPSAV